MQNKIKSSPTRAAIDLSILRGSAATDELLRIERCALRVKIENDGAALADAAARLAARLGAAWLRKNNAALGRIDSAQAQQEIESIFRAAAIGAVMRGGDSLFSCRAAIRTAYSEARAEIYIASGRDGRDVAAGWSIIGSMPAPAGGGSRPDQSAGSAPASWRGEARGALAGTVRQARARARELRAESARIIAAGGDRSEAGRLRSLAVRTVSGPAETASMLGRAIRGEAMPPEIIGKWTEPGEDNRARLTEAGKKAVQRLKKSLS